MYSQEGNDRSGAKRRTILLRLGDIAWMVAVSILSLPLGGMIPLPGIENSWIIGLNMAFSRGMQFGKDVVFTFGPLGFLYLPNFCDVNNWMAAYISGLLVHFILVLFVYLLLSKVAQSRLAFFISSGLLVFVLPFLTIDYKLVLIGLLVFNSVIMFQAGSRRLWLSVVIMSLCLAFASAIKFSAAIMSAGIIASAMAILAYRRRFKALAIMVVSYLLFYVGIWIATGQQFTNLFAYLRNSMEISSGYNYAMSLGGVKTQLAAGVAGICLFYVIFVYGLIKRKRGLIVFMLPFCVLAFIAFKHSFVRHDWGHVSVFFAVMLFLFGLIYLTCGDDIGRLPRILLLILCGVMGLFTVTQGTHISQSIPQRLRSNQLSMKVFADGSTYRQNLLSDFKMFLRSQFQLKPEIVEYVRDKRIDVIPWDINLLWAYDMNWSPRPVFQSYSAYTKSLDLLNAGFYEERPPDFLFYKVNTIDERYAIFDEPATFREILLNYKPIFTGLLLGKKDELATFERYSISTVEAKIGEEIPIPQADGYLFARVGIEYSLPGKLATIFYKGDEMRVYLATDDEIFEHRFIPSTAENGVFLSRYVANEQDLFDVFNGKAGKSINSVRFTTGNEWFYKGKIKIEFFEIRAN